MSLLRSRSSRTLPRVWLRPGRYRWESSSTDAPSGYFLYEPLPILLADIAGGDVRIVLEQDEILALNSLSQESSLEVERVEREQIVPHHPYFRKMRGRRQQV